MKGSLRFYETMPAGLLVIVDFPNQILGLITNLAI